MFPLFAVSLDCLRLLGVARCVCCITYTIFYSNLHFRKLRAHPIKIENYEKMCLSAGNAECNQLTEGTRRFPEGTKFFGHFTVVSDLYRHTTELKRPFDP